MYGQTLILSSRTPNRTEYAFKEWSTGRCSATSATYETKASHTNIVAATMFAVWEGKGIPTFTYTGSYQILNVVILLYLIFLHIQKIEKLDFYLMKL